MPTKKLTDPLQPPARGKTSKAAVPTRVEVESGPPPPTSAAVFGKSILCKARQSQVLYCDLDACRIGIDERNDAALDDHGSLQAVLQSAIYFDVPHCTDITCVALNTYTAAVAQANQVWYYDIASLSGEDRRFVSRTYAGIVTALVLGRTHAAFIMDGDAFIHDLIFTDQVEAVRVPASVNKLGQSTAVVTELFLTDDFLITCDSDLRCTYYLLHDHLRCIAQISGCLRFCPNARGTLAIMCRQVDVQSQPEHEGHQEEQWGIYDVDADLFVPLSAPLRSEEVLTAIWSAAANYSRRATLLLRPSNGDARQQDVTLLQVEYSSQHLEPSCWSLSFPMVEHILPVYVTNHDMLYLSKDFSLGVLPLMAQTDEAEVISGPVWTTSPRGLAPVRRESTSSKRRSEDLTAASSFLLGARQSGHAADVRLLESRAFAIDDQMVVAAYMALLSEADISKATRFFLKSSQPHAALELHKALCQYDEALTLATSLKSTDVPVLCLKLATNCEQIGDIRTALHHFHRCLASIQEDAMPVHRARTSGPYHTSAYRDRDIDDLRAQAELGQYRCYIRMGDVGKALRGLASLKHSDESGALTSCASLLEDIRQYREAATLYQKAQKFNEAFRCALKAKNAALASSLLDKVTHVPTLLAHGEHMVEQHQYLEAERAFRQAGDDDRLCALYIEHMKDVELAASIVRNSRNKSGARHIARHFAKTAQHAEHIEFCIIAGLFADAFEYAEAQHCMPLLFAARNDDFDQHLYLKMATYFDRMKDALRAGDCWCAAGFINKALERYITTDTNATTEDGIERAVKLIEQHAKSASSPLAKRLLSFLLGDIDGIPKNPKFVFQFYLLVGAFQEAAHFALSFAKDEQTKGNYKVAHELLFQNAARLKEHGFPIPLDLDLRLCSLHSYMLIKTLAKIDQQAGTASLLSRVATNIGDFPKHDVAILTSAIIENYKVNRKRTAFKFATILLRPENRARIDEQYKRRIETIVRRPEDEESEESLAPCYHCGDDIPLYQLECAICKQRQPFCIASGQHVIKKDMTRCPHCEFPANITAWRAWIGVTAACPLCFERVIQ